MIGGVPVAGGTVGTVGTVGGGGNVGGTGGKNPILTGVTRPGMSRGVRRSAGPSMRRGTRRRGPPRSPAPGSPLRPLPNKPTSSRMTDGTTICGTITGSGMLLPAHSPQLGHASLRFRAAFFQTAAFFPASCRPPFDRAGWSTPAAGLLFPGRGRAFFGRSLFPSSRPRDSSKKRLNCCSLLRRRCDAAR